MVSQFIMCTNFAGYRDIHLKLLWYTAVVNLNGLQIMKLLPWLTWNIQTSAIPVPHEDNENLTEMTGTITILIDC